MTETAQRLTRLSRVALVDDHAIVRSGLRRLIELEPTLTVSHQFADGDAAYATLSSAVTDVLVLDISMPGRDGLDLLWRMKLRDPGLKVIVFSMHDSQPMAQQALRGGANGYVSKSRSSPQALVDAITQVREGKLQVDEALAPPPLASGRSDAPEQNFTPREFVVYRMMLAGASVATIAQQLSLSAKTVSNYETIARQKLGVETTFALLHQAQQR